MLTKADMSEYGPEVTYILTGAAHGGHDYYLGSDGRLYGTPEQAFAEGVQKVTHLLYGVTFEERDMRERAVEAVCAVTFPVTSFDSFEKLLETLRAAVCI